VQKTHSGEKFGRAFSEDEVRHWFKNWNNSHESMFISIIPNGSPPYGTPPYDIPTEIGFFALKDIFDLKENGEYELHVQLILTQAGKDSAGKLHFPRVALPETIAKVRIIVAK